MHIAQSGSRKGVFVSCRCLQDKLMNTAGCCSIIKIYSDLISSKSTNQPFSSSSHCSQRQLNERNNTTGIPEFQQELPGFGITDSNFQNEGGKKEQPFLSAHKNLLGVKRDVVCNHIIPYSTATFVVVRGSNLFYTLQDKVHSMS